MIALVLGGAPSVWKDLERAKRICGAQAIVVAANLAGIHFEGRLDAWCSLHSDRLGPWARQRKGNKDFEAFTPTFHPATPLAEVVEEQWPGSSGLYALQIALTQMNAAGAILCGIPMRQADGHFVNPGAWAATGDYRSAFGRALPALGGRVRSMGGWTAELFGTPTEAWVETINTARPAASPSRSIRSPTMHTVENISDTTKSFTARNSDGGLRTVHLSPGESGDFDIDPRQPKFADGGPLKVSPAAKAHATPRVKPEPKPKAKAKAQPKAKPVTPTDGPVPPID